ncbi:MAG: hypothetical protein K1X47_16515 [Cyclobacteriaceae bacterium]|mgnify:CR=1 FL=1|nr:hypothetical protein [Cyclobacteriaceae bacterium]
METFNKNWLAILLVAVVFGTLGFLIGRVTGHAPVEEREIRVSGPGGMRLDPSDSIDVQVEVEGGGSEVNVETTVKSDTIIKDGKKIIVREVRKIKK